MTPNPIDHSSDNRLNDVLLAYLEACETGQEPDRAEFLAAHPDLRDDLATFFAGRDEIERLAGPVRDRERQNLDSPLEALACAPDDELGRLGDFRLIREVGRGGMGVVYEAEQISLRRRVALKVLPFASAIDPRRLQRFKNEAAAAANLRHEHIVPVHAVGCERGVHYYAMQFVDGQSLAALIAELRRSKAEAPGTIPAQSTIPVAQLSTDRSTGGTAHFDWVARLGRQSALALEHAHQT
jgi:serine/threonine protein kinase